MEDKKILENNKLIAEFMGTNIVKRNNEDAVFMFENAAFPEYFRCTHYNRYHLSWDLIMPVINKIILEDNYGEININAAQISFKCGKYKSTLRVPRSFIGGLEIPTPEILWKIVVDYIKWYNENK